MHNSTRLSITRQNIGLKNFLICNVFGLMLFLAALVIFWMPFLVHPKTLSGGHWLYIFTGLFILLVALYYESVWLTVLKGPAIITLERDTEEEIIRIRENRKTLATLPLHLISDVYIERLSHCGVSYYLKVKDPDGNTLLSLELTPITGSKISKADTTRMIHFLNDLDAWK